MDRKLFFLINREWTGPIPDRLMAALSSLDFWIPLLLLLIVALVVFGGFKGRALLATAVVTVIVTDSIVVNSLKHLVNRARPLQAEAVRVVTLKKASPKALGVLYSPKVKISKPESGPIEGRSFPSGHTSNNFAMAVLLTAFYPRRGWLYFFVAAAISYSRIYTGSHWPSDVAASVVLGVGLGLLMVFLAKKVWSRWGGSVAPTVYRRHPHLLEDKTELVAQ